jgi:hypothetical protein
LALLPPVLGLHVTGVEGQALVVFLQDEIDDTGDRLAAVQCRGAVGQHFDALARARWDFAASGSDATDAP